MDRRNLLGLGLIGLAAGRLGLRPGMAQSSYPERPITLVVPFAPGGSGDAVGRPWAEKMKSLLGSVVIENQGGAGGLTGGTAVARANADGYTLLLGNLGTHVIVPTAGANPPYDPVGDLVPVSIVVVSAMTIIIHPSLPVSSLDELVSYAKANPGKLSYGSSGAGSASHLTGELFKMQAGIRIISVPYKGAGQMMNDVISGHIPMGVANVTGQIIELHRAEKVKMLAVTTPSRIHAAPDIPTALEAGVKGMVAQNFLGPFAPAATPRPVIDRIAQATGAAMRDEAFRQKLITSGFEPFADSDPDAARRFIEVEISRWAPVVKAIGTASN
jgi:tripartite-type tricarboxylate transporter receptor subunit TctC